MSTPSAHQDLAGYRSDLLLALRLHDVPGPRIAEALAEVDSHVTETGEDPVAAFGPPRDYARELATVLGGAGPSSPWRLLLTGWTWSHALIGVLSLVGCGLLADGVFAVGADAPSSVGLPGTATVALGLAALAVLGVVLVRELRRTSDRVLDPRTGADMAGPLPRWAFAVTLGLPVALLVANGVLGVLSR